MEQQRSKEWFEKRKGKITGSIAGALLGLSPFKSQINAIKELKEPVEPDQFVKDVIFNYGIQMEHHAIEMFKLETGYDVKETGFHVYQDWIGASPDGIVLNEQGDEIGLIEIKCPYSLRDEENPVFKTAVEQPHYYAQMQIEMLSTGYSEAYFYQYANGKGALELIRRDNAWLSSNLPTLYMIWEAQFNNLRPLDYKTKEYFDIDKQIKALDKRKKELMAEFKDSLNNKGGIIGNALLTMSSRKGSIDYKKAFKDRNIDEEEYRKNEVSTWNIASF